MSNTPRRVRLGARAAREWGTQNVAAQHALMFRDFAEQSFSETRAVPLHFRSSSIVRPAAQESRYALQLRTCVAFSGDAPDPDTRDFNVRLPRRLCGLRGDLQFGRDIRVRSLRRRHPCADEHVAACLKGELAAAVYLALDRDVSPVSRKTRLPLSILPVTVIRFRSDQFSRRRRC